MLKVDAVSATGVRLTGDEPPASMTKMSKSPPSAVPAKRDRLPSGENAGCELNEPRPGRQVDRP